MGSGGPGGCRAGIRELGSSQLAQQGWGQMELAALVPSEHLTPCCSQLPPWDILCPSDPGKIPPCAPQMVRGRNVGMSPFPAVLPSQPAMNQTENTPVFIKLTRFASFLRENDPSGAGRGVFRCLLPLRVSGCVTFGFGFDQKCRVIPSPWDLPKPENPFHVNFYD